MRRRAGPPRTGRPVPPHGCCEGDAATVLAIAARNGLGATSGVGGGSGGIEDRGNCAGASVGRCQPLARRPSAPRSQRRSPDHVTPGPRAGAEAGSVGSTPPMRIHEYPWPFSSSPVPGSRTAGPNGPIGRRRGDRGQAALRGRGRARGQGPGPRRRRGKAGFVKLVKLRRRGARRRQVHAHPPHGLPADTARRAWRSSVCWSPRPWTSPRSTTSRSPSTAPTTPRPMIASAEGGVEIEAGRRAESRRRSSKSPLHPLLGLQAVPGPRAGVRPRLQGQAGQPGRDIMIRLAKLFHEKDARSRRSIRWSSRPAHAKHPDGQVLAIDAKFNFDDNALFRHNDIADMCRPHRREPAELRANKFGLSYIALDGNIGCLVNGAGLAMGTMDIVKLHGGEPANFLDVGGSASEEAVTEAFRIILSDPREGRAGQHLRRHHAVRQIARAIVAAAKEVGFKVPLVVRLEGTNVDEARHILEEAGARSRPCRPPRPRRRRARCCARRWHETRHARPLRHRRHDAAHRAHGVASMLAAGQRALRRAHLVRRHRGGGPARLAHLERPLRE